VGTDAQERGHSTALFCVCRALMYPALDVKGATIFVNPVEGSLYVGLLFEGYLEISTVLWSGLHNQSVTCTTYLVLGV
jgi:hypothetical protein